MPKQHEQTAKMITFNYTPTYELDVTPSIIIAWRNNHDKESRTMRKLLTLAIIPTIALTLTTTPNSMATEPYYKNCAAARAAGAAPLHKGQPGYRPELDRDGDGTACE